MKTNSKHRRNTLLVIAAITIFITGMMKSQNGYTQITSSNFDGAPALDPGQFEISLLTSGTYATYEEDLYLKGIIPGIKLGFGLGKNVDLKFAYSRGIYKYNFTEWSDK